MRNPEIDAFAKARLSPEHREHLERIRKLMADHAPEADEVISSGSPAWRGAKILAIISPSKTHLTFAFERGASFTDRHGLLQGEGKRTRHVKIRTWTPELDEALPDYIAQAVDADG
ncbi:uncharacterized protein DUF1801 [Brevibacterium sanguinis]|uniref:Uncharacterized protein DUF1801 n=2 Tax=Brevibacterium TaxID=1696 RepID=A0A366IQC7_9MICO|nr:MULTISPECIES: DUF1801 domain-containing protein [Brevibacterium]RBP68032.1 uncharacterized protein DUF1801 [Brevibacterium sanguinis]RBP74551.1 uncharacterized protein DUF1801 [Brevibacterium celere]